MAGVHFKLKGSDLHFTKYHFNLSIKIGKNVDACVKYHFSFETEKINYCDQGRR